MPTWRESVSFDANVEALSALEGPGLQLTRILEDDVPALMELLQDARFQEMLSLPEDVDEAKVRDLLFDRQMLLVYVIVPEGAESAVGLAAIVGHSGPAHFMLEGLQPGLIDHEFEFQRAVMLTLIPAFFAFSTLDALYLHIEDELPTEVFDALISSGFDPLPDALPGWPEGTQSFKLRRETLEAMGQ